MLAAAGSLFAQQNPAVTPVVADNFEIGAQLGFESRYVYRGIECADESMQAIVNCGYALGGNGAWGFNVYGEMFYNSPISSDDNENNEIDWKLGTRAVYEEEYFFDLGYVFRTYPDAALNRSNEIFFGIGRDVELVEGKDWSRVIIDGKVSYDWNLEQLAWEFSAEKEFKEVVDKNMDVVVGATYGYVTSNDWDGDQDHGLSSPSNDYGYLALTADAIYHLDNGADLVLGVRYAYNNDHGRYDDNGNKVSVDCNEFWWGASIRFRY